LPTDSVQTLCGGVSGCVHIQLARGVDGPQHPINVERSCIELEVDIRIDTSDHGSHSVYEALSTLIMITNSLELDLGDCFVAIPMASFEGDYYARQSSFLMHPRHVERPPDSMRSRLQPPTRAMITSPKPLLILPQSFPAPWIIPCAVSSLHRRHLPLPTVARPE
jgi:hypothetical protein